MTTKGGTIDEHAVAAAGGAVLPGGAGVRVGGWTVTSGRGPIACDAEMDQLKEALGARALPEQCYTGNHLCLTHDASGARVAFTAEAALRGWLADASPRVEVAGSRGWQEARRAEMEANDAATFDYDWTFTTAYSGDASAGASGAPAAWGPSAEGMDRALLTSRDPILYYDDVPLYESELEDHGEASVGVKVRVMPRCWYALLRFFLRVDGVLVRLREVRLFCRLDGAAAEGGVVVLREVRHQEGTFAELAAGGAPPAGPAYADAEAAAVALAAVAPVGVARYALERAVL